MEKHNRHIELLAPVGSFESLHAAIKAKANAIYFGIKQLNMRQKSSKNFSINDIPKVVSICKKNNVRSYLTINVVIYDSELSYMMELIDKAKIFGIDAIIATDLSVILYAHKKKLPVHISTQANITNIESIQFYAQYADTIILARELTLKQIKNICNTIKNKNICGPSGKLIKIEVFIHGALCMSISGKCYLSLHHYNQSANRGICRQDCRKEYLVTEKETGMQISINNKHIMSPKDLCTIGFLNKILDTGVSVLKIEGRARSPEYVKTVTECYTEAINSYLDNSFKKSKINDWKKKLATVFNRGFWDGYYLGQRLGEWSEKYGSSATKKKIYIGKGIKYFSKLKVAEFILESHTLSVGDEILIIGPTTGVLESKVEEIRVVLKSVTSAQKGDRISIPIDTKIRPSDRLYKYELVEG